MNEEVQEHKEWRCFVSESYALIGLVVSSERVVVMSYDHRRYGYPMLSRLEDMPEDIMLFSYKLSADEQKVDCIVPLQEFAAQQGYLPY